MPVRNEIEDMELIRKRSLVRVQAGPLRKVLQKTVFCRQEERAGIRFLAPFTATRTGHGSRDGTQRRFHRLDCGVLHVGEDVGVGVEGDGYGGVTQHLGDNLHVDAFAQEQRGAGVCLRSWKRKSSRTPERTLMRLKERLRRFEGLNREPVSLGKTRP